MTHAACPVLPKKWLLKKMLGVATWKASTLGLRLTASRSSAHLAVGVECIGCLNFVPHQSIWVEGFDSRAKAIRAVESAAVGAGIVRRNGG